MAANRKTDTAPSPNKLAGFLIIGNPENRRVSMFIDAAISLGHRARVHAYEMWLDGTPPDPTPDEIIRIESSGENTRVENALIRLGDPALEPSEEFGIIQHHRAWYAGFSTLLETLPNDSRFMNTPASILTMFDKGATHERLHNVVDQPERFDVASWDELADAYNPGRYFIKPRYGSSASGVIALSMKGDKVLARTPIERDGDAFYNRLHAREIHDVDEIRARFEFVMSLGAVVERWVPKATLSDTRTFDLRIVCIGGRAQHSVVRCSHGPITNLHLGNTRGELSDVVEQFGQDTVDALFQSAERAVEPFPTSLYCGVDIAMTSRGKPVVFELNAFGDLLPNVLVDGRGTYEAEIFAMLENR